MRLITLFSAGSHIPAATLNLLQRRGAGLSRASASPSDGPGVLGADIVHYQTPDAGLATGTVATVDASTGYDWRERLVLCWTRFAAAAANRWGRASEHAGNDPSASDHRTAMNPTGPGATGAAAATVANGTPPIVGTDSCPIPIDTRAGGTLWLFADPTSGALKVYNDTGVTLHFDLIAFATGREVNPSEPPPDLVPTMTEVLWLTPSLAADRPASPEGIALHRATDTGVVSLYDGGAWRALTYASPLTTRGDLYVRGVAVDERLALGTRGHVMRAGATDPSWSASAASAAGLPAAGADYAAAVYWDTTTGGHFVCTFGGPTPAWGWRVLDAFRGFVDTTGTEDDVFKVVGSVDVPANSVLLVDVDVVGRRDDGSTGMVARGSCGFITDGSAATELEPLTLLVGDDTRVRVVGNGLAFDVEVKGVAAQDWTWRVRGTVRAEVNG